jgi:hypothetical protein
MADKVSEHPLLPTDLEPLVMELNGLLSLLAFRVNRSLMEIVKTAELPASGSVEDGTVMLEDAGPSAVNMIVYAKGLRFRISGGAPF